MKAISEQISELIDEVEDEGYNLEMEIEKVDYRSSGSQRRLRAIATVCKKLKGVMKFAESKGL